MAICTDIDIDGNIEILPETVSECTSFVMLDSADYALLLELYDITPEEVLYCFSWGFGAVVFFWYLGYGIGVAKKAINKL